MENKKIKIGLIIYGAIVAVIGIVVFILAFCNVGVIDQIISYSLAVLLFILGLFLVVTSIITSDQASNLTMVLGAVAVALGLVLCILPHLITGFLVIFLGSLLVCLGAVSLAKMVIAIIHKEKASIIITYAIAAVLAVVIGAVALAFANGAATVMYAGVGLVITIVGIGVIVKAFQNKNAPVEAK